MEPQSPSSTHQACLIDVWQGARYYLFSLEKEVDDGLGSAETLVLSSQLRLVLPLLRSLSLTKRSGLVMIG